MTQPPTPKRDWIHYVIVIALAGAVGTGSALFITNRQNKAPAPPANILNPGTNITSAPADGAAPTPSTTDEPPPMLAGNMPPPQAALTLGNWYFDHRNWEKCIKKYKLAISLGLDNPNVRTDLGSAYRFSGDAEKALKEYEHAQEMDPSHENSLFNQGAVYVLMLKQPQKGVDIWKEYLERFPQGQSVEHAKKLIAHAEEELNLKN